MTDKFKLIDQLKGIIDQSKFINNILISRNDIEFVYIDKYINELKEMVNRLKDE